MARRLRGIAADGTKYVVHFDREWREWQVRAYRKNKAGVWKFAEGPTYYCEDRKDATQTFYHLVGHGPAGTHINPRLRRWGFPPGTRVSLKGNTSVEGTVVDPKGWIPAEQLDNFNLLKLVCVKWENDKRVHTIEAHKLVKYAKNPKRYIMHAQGYGPGPTFENKAAAILAIRALIREDVKNCRRHFGSAFVENWQNKVWEVRPVRYRGPGYVMWSRYSLSEV